MYVMVMDQAARMVSGMRSKGMKFWDMWGFGIIFEIEDM